MAAKVIHIWLSIFSRNRLTFEYQRLMLKVSSTLDGSRPMAVCVSYIILRRERGEISFYYIVIVVYWTLVYIESIIYSIDGPNHIKAWRCKAFISSLSICIKAYIAFILYNTVGDLYTFFSSLRRERWI
jgi:hypothetical protein